jgi:hypothetical protein
VAKIQGVCGENLKKVEKTVNQGAKKKCMFSMSDSHHRHVLMHHNPFAGKEKKMLFMQTITDH